MIRPNPSVQDDDKTEHKTTPLDVSAVISPPSIVSLGVRTEINTQNSISTFTKHLNFLLQFRSCRQFRVRVKGFSAASEVQRRCLYRVIFITKMPMLTAASTIVNSPLLPAVGQCRGQFKLSSRGAKKVHFDRKMVHLKVGAVGLAQFPLERRNPVMVSSRTQSASVICASALNARCGAEQTQTVTREAPTITHLPGKEKSPLLDDGGSGFPPRDDGDGGGGGGGGGGNWSGGFAFFGFLLFLSFLKDKESEGSYRENRRR